MTPPSKIRVCIVEDQAPVRQGLVRMLERFDDCTCTGTFADGVSACAGLPADPPDVVLMDINMPGMGGIECVRRLKAQLEATEFLMLTVYDNDESIFQALEAGASGYLLKRADPAELHAAIRQIHEGGAPMDSQIARRVVQVFRKAPAAGGSAEISQLTTREKEVLDLLAGGLLYKEIAQKLSISYATVNNHVRHIYEKLHVQSRSQAVARYLKIKPDF